MKQIIFLKDPLDYKKRDIKIKNLQFVMASLMILTNTILIKGVIKFGCPTFNSNLK